MTLVCKQKRWVELLHLACLSILLVFESSGQNLISNYSFEQVDSNVQRDCSIGVGYVDALSAWQGLNTVDFVHQDFPFTNRSGNQKVVPHTGKSMVGVYLIDCGDGWLPEYLFQQLSFPVKDGKKYRLSFYLHFRSKDSFFPCQITFILTNKNPCFVPVEALDGEMVNLEVESSKKTDERWVFFSKEFVPVSDANYLVAGSFEKPPQTIRKKGRDLDKGVYVFMDDIELVALEDIEETPNPSAQLAANRPDSVCFEAVEQQQDTFLQGSLLVNYEALPTISFDYNSFSISPYYQKILSETAAYLPQRQCTIVVTGHTDSTGSDEYNEQLAFKRAQAVADFLISKSVPKDKIIIVSQGSKKPLSLGEDDFSRSMNRRVEITLQCN